MITRCQECGKDFQTNRSARIYCGQSCSNRAIAREREAAKPILKPVIVWSCGGGVQSSAIAALIVNGKLPKPDYAVMVDVGYEKTSSLDNVRNILRPALAAVGVNLQIIKTTDYRDNNLFDPSGHLVLPAYRRQENGEIGKLNTHCSAAWKQKVVMKWLREQGVNRAIGWIGISADERRRVHSSPFKWYTWEYPLIALGMDRTQCHIEIYKAGWERVQHSSCYICPMQSNEQWLYTKHYYPDDWQKACIIDGQIRDRDCSLYLHGSGLPLAEWATKNPGLGILSCGGGCETCG